MQLLDSGFHVTPRSVYPIDRLRSLWQVRDDKTRHPFGRFEKLNKFVVTRGVRFVDRERGGGIHDALVKVRQALVKAFGGHSGYMEDVAFANGAVPPAGPCYVYLAVWQAGSDRRIPAV
jgi:hypothetical protein